MNIIETLQQMPSVDKEELQNRIQRLLSPVTFFTLIGTEYCLANQIDELKEVPIGTFARSARPNSPNSTMAKETLILNKKSEIEFLVRLLGEDPVVDCIPINCSKLYLLTRKGFHHYVRQGFSNYAIQWNRVGSDSLILQSQSKNNSELPW